MRKTILTTGLIAGGLALAPLAQADNDGSYEATSIAPPIDALPAAVAPVSAYDSSLDLSGAANTYIESPSGDLDSYPGYVTTMDDLYLKPLGDTETPSLALSDLPTNSYSYATTVPEGAKLVENQVLADYNAGELSAAHPDVILGYSDSTVMDSEAMPVLEADGVPSQDVDFVFVGDTSQPVTGYLADSSNAWLLNLVGMGDLINQTTPTNYFTVDDVMINGDGFADATANNWEGSTLHELYPGLDTAEINSAVETTTGDLHTFVLDLDASETWTAAVTALDAVFGW